MGRTSRAGPDPNDSDGREDRDQGMVTVEAAIALCGLVTVVVLALAGLTALVAKVQCVDAAREAARLAAIGDRAGADDAGRRIAPSGASVDITTDPASVTVEVSDDLIEFLHVEARAYAVKEPAGA